MCMCCLFVIVGCVVVFLFFFSSRRRHTRSTRDWSSDVCSSDLAAPVPGPTPVTTATGFFLSTAGFLLRLAVNDPAAFEPRKFVGVVAQLCENGRVVFTQLRSQLANRGGSAIEARHRPRHSHPAERFAFKLLQDVVLADLLVLQQFKSADDRRGWNIVGEQPRQNFVSAPLLQLG